MCQKHECGLKKENNDILGLRGNQETKPQLGVLMKGSTSMKAFNGGRGTLNLEVERREEEEAGSRKSKIERVPSAEPAASLAPQ